MAASIERTLHEIIPNSVQMDDQRYLGHMTSQVPTEANTADLIISLLNQNAVKIESGRMSTYIERQTIAWMHHLAFQNSENFYKKHIHHRKSCLGSVVSGGTIGNLTSLLVARNKALPGVDEFGLVAALKKHKHTDLAVICSSRGHYSLKKVCMALGMGTHSLHVIPVIPHTNKIRVDLLEEKIQELKQKRICIVAVVGIAGSTETGSFDPIEKMAAICKKENIWMHVDAAWGGALFLSHKYRTLLSGAEAADSIVIDGHKLMGQTMGHGMVLYKNPQSAHAISHSSRYVIREESQDAGRFTLEGSKPFNAFSTWFLAEVLGRKGLGLRIDKSVENTATFEQKVSQSIDFELTSEVQSNIITYRYFPRRFHTFVCDSIPEFENATRPSSAAILVWSWLNEVNTQIQQRQMKTGHYFVSRTSLESIKSHGNEWVTVLRAVPFNVETTELDIVNTLKEQSALGLKAGIDSLFMLPKSMQAAAKKALLETI